MHAPEGQLELTNMTHTITDEPDKEVLSVTDELKKQLPVRVRRFEFTSSHDSSMGGFGGSQTTVHQPKNNNSGATVH